MSSSQRSLCWWLAGALVIASVVKAALLAADVLPFNADESIVALMARHILQGERPVFFYGQAYMGSLDAYLAALGFLIFGEQVWVLRLVQVSLYLATLLSTAALGKSAFGSGRVGVLAAWLLAIPAVNIGLYTTVTLGGYGEMLLMGNLILLVALRIAKKSAGWLWLLFGFLAGGGLWVFGLTLVYTLPALFYLIWKNYANGSWEFENVFVRSIRAIRGLGKNLVYTFSGGIVGSAPWWGYALQNGVQASIAELTGAAIPKVAQLPYLARVVHHIFNFIVLGVPVILGIRPPWEVRLLAFPLLPFALAFWLGVIIFIARERHALTGGRTLLIMVPVTLFSAFIFTPFGVDASGRYFLPLVVPLALFAADLILHLREVWGRWVYGLAVLILSFNLWGTVESALRFPPGLTTQLDVLTQIDHRYDEELIDFLKARGELRGYTHYWVAYPLAFQSKEALIFVPHLPYHLDFRPGRDDRYKPYNPLVESADRVAYITTGQLPLEARLRAGFKSQGTTWQEATIGDYRVFFDLSQPVRPEEVGLGANSLQGIHPTSNRTGITDRDGSTQAGNRD